MKMDSEKYRILYFSTTGDGESLCRVLKRENFVLKAEALSKGCPLEGFLFCIDEFAPDILIADFHRDSIEDLFKVINKSENRMQLVLLTKAENEDLVIPFVESGVASDYLYCDRLKKLPLIINKLIKDRQSCKIDQKLFENSRETSFFIYPDGKLRNLLSPAKSFLNYSQEEIQHLNLFELIYFEDREIIQNQFTACLQKPKESIWDLPVRVEDKDGEQLWLEVGFMNLLCDKTESNILVSTRDVTNYKIAELNERKYRGIYENSGEGILLTKPNGEILAANPAACSIFQRTEEEICSLGRAGLVDESDPHLFKALQERRRRGKVKVELIMKRKDGSKFPAEVSSSVFQYFNKESRTSLIVRDISESRRAEEQLRSSTENYFRLFENSPLPTVIYDINSLEILEVNFAATKYYDYERKEFLSLTILDFIRDKEIPDFRKFLENQEEEGKVVQHRMVHLKNGQNPITVETFGYSLEYKNRKCRLVICLDVSEKEDYLRRLKTKSFKLQMAQEVAKLGYWEQDFSTGGLFWSQEVYNIWQKEEQEFAPTFEFYKNTIHPEDRDRVFKALDRAIKGESDLDMEHRIVIPDGSVKWIHEKGRLVPNLAGEMVFGGTVQDITERKLIAEKLSRSEARHRAILKSQTNYLIRTDLEGHYSYCNEKFRSDFEWIFPGGEIIGSEALKSVQPYHYTRVEEVFKQCILRPNRVFQVEIDKLQRDGGAKSTLWDFICLTDSTGESLEVQCVGIDITDRVKTEKSLQESINRNELVLKATSDAIYDWNCSTGEIFWSEGYNKLFGYDPAHKTPNIDGWIENIHPEDSEVGEAVLKAVAGTDDIFQAEYRYKRANGEYAYVVEKGTIVRDEQGEAIRMVGALQDITDRKSALLKLMKSEARHKGLIQSQTNYIIRVDLEGKYTYSNKKFKDDFGWIYPDKNIIGKNSMDSIMAYHYSRIQEVAEKCLANPDRVFQIEIDKPARNGGVKTTLWDMIFLKSAGSGSDEIQCVGIDITDRVKAEAENYFQANLLNKIGQAVIATDVNGKIVYWNNAATDIYGWTIEEALGDRIDYIFPKFGQKSFSVDSSGKEAKVWSGELKVQKKSGDEIDIFLTNSPIYNENGDLTGFIGVSSDISERIKADNELKELNRDLKKYTEELIAANKGLEQFSYIISHNLRAPVANIIGLGNLIDEDYPEEVKKKFKDEMLNNVKRLDSIIRDLNSILQVKVETSEKKEFVDLDDLVNSIKEVIGQVIEKEKIEIITDFTEVPVLNSIRTYLHSVFYNLIFNSIKYRQLHVFPVLKITSLLKEDKVVLTFEDNGIGIDLEKRGGEIFGLYKRFHHHVEGKGMGLFMVKTQVELMGGKIQVSSEVGKGSLFTIEFEIDNKLAGLKDEEAETVHCN